MVFTKHGDTIGVAIYSIRRKESAEEAYMANDVNPNPQNLPSTSVADIPQLVAQANEIHAGATKISAQKIVFDNGTIYQDNGTSHIVAGNGGIVEVTEKTTTVTIANPGISLKEALPTVVETYTQEVAAAFANTSQPSVSVQLNPPDKK